MQLHRPFVTIAVHTGLLSMYVVTRAPVSPVPLIVNGWVRTVLPFEGRSSTGAGGADRSTETVMAFEADDTGTAGTALERCTALTL